MFWWGTLQFALGMVLVLASVFRTHRLGVIWVFQDRGASLLYGAGALCIVVGAWNARTV